MMKASVVKTGFRFDRRWMLVDQEQTFMTQRTYPRMALISVQVKSDHLGVTAPGMVALRVPLEIVGDSTSVIVWNDRVDATDLGDDAARWFSEFLETTCRLVYLPDTSVRRVDPAHSANSDQVSFADAYPFLMISEGSLQDLNRRLETPVPVNRFRPNLVVAGCEAFAEDSWEAICIGGVMFRVVKPCSRCTIPTVNQATGERGKEPLRTLSRYREHEGRVFFGQNLIHNALGELKVGDTVKVLKQKNSDE